jgi:hypothetical protein
LRFDHQIANTSIEIGTEHTTRYGQQITFDDVRYWVTNVWLLDGEEAKVEVPASYYLVELTPQRTRTDVEVPVPVGSYETLVFHIGVDPPHNRSLDLAEGELSAGIEMDWDWDTGYKFFRTDGTFVEQGTAGMFSLHTGNDVLYKELTAELPEPIEITEDVPVDVSFVAEIDRLFAGIELSETNQILGGTIDSPAGKAAGNYGRMYSLVTPDGLVPLSATSPNVDTGSGGPMTIPTDSTPPELTAAVIELPDGLRCDPVPGRPADQVRACFTPFLLGTGSDYVDAGFQTFVTDNGAEVRAAAAGIVTEIAYTAHSDVTHSDLYQLSVRAGEDSAFWVDYRNVKELRVAEGDTVQAGDVLGTTGDLFDAAFGAVSLGLHRQQEVVQRLCPTQFQSAGVREATAAALQASNAAWPELQHSSVCEVPSLLCIGMRCEVPDDFVAVGGDVDAGRRIYATDCAGCHGTEGQGISGPELCFGASCTCDGCIDHDTLAARIAVDMPPDAPCTGACADNVTAFILSAFTVP